MRPEAGVVAHLAASEVIDAAAACDGLGNDLSLYRRRLAHARVFLADWPLFFRASRQLGQPDQAARLADDLAGIAATIGAQPLSDAARDLERRCAPAWPAPSSTAWSTRCWSACRQVVQALSQAFDAEKTATNGSSAWPSKER